MRHLRRPELRSRARRHDLDSGAVEVIAIGDLPVEAHAVRTVGQCIETEGAVRGQKVIPAGLDRVQERIDAPLGGGLRGGGLHGGGLRGGGLHGGGLRGGTLRTRALSLNLQPQAQPQAHQQQGGGNMSNPDHVDALRGLNRFACLIAQPFDEWQELRFIPGRHPCRSRPTARLGGLPAPESAHDRKKAPQTT